MIPLRKALGAVIARRRKADGFSQESFAAAAKVHRTYMTGIERGEHNPSLDVIVRIASALDLSLHDLIAEAEQEAKRTKRS